jgi:hypothetical protein
VLLDPQTGKELACRAVVGGYAVAALLENGRVVVASTQEHGGGKGRVTVLDPSLRRVLPSHAEDPCTLAKTSQEQLLRRFEPAAAYETRFGPDSVTLELGAGRLAHTEEHQSGLEHLAT